MMFNLKVLLDMDTQTKRVPQGSEGGTSLIFWKEEVHVLRTGWLRSAQMLIAETF